MVTVLYSSPNLGAEASPLATGGRFRPVPFMTQPKPPSGVDISHKVGSARAISSFTSYSHYSNYNSNYRNYNDYSNHNDYRNYNDYRYIYDKHQNNQHHLVYDSLDHGLKKELASVQPIFPILHTSSYHLVFWTMQKFC